MIGAALGKIPIWIVVVFGAAAVVLGVYLLVQLSPQFLGSFSASDELREKAPGFELLDVSGTQVALSDFLGRNAILVFWTPWNEASLEELLVLDNYMKYARRDDVAVLAIASGEDAASAQKAVAGYDLKIQVLLDTDGAVGESYGTSVLPLTVFINKIGFIEKSIVGPISPEDLRQEIANLY